jgi:hypothetical protein
VAGLLVLVVAIGLGAARTRDSRLSGAVAFAPDGANTAAFLADPGVGYVDAYLRFGPDLADDVIMFVDQEMLEGTTNPRWAKGGDWMAFVGVQRSGAVWVGGGSDATTRGKPSSDRKWDIVSLGQRLDPDTWYRVRVVADFGKRRFKSFAIQGGKLDRTLDISRNVLDYPNAMPFDRAGMVYIVGAMRGKSMMQREGTPLAYFDDVEGGIVRSDGSLQPMFKDDFETQAAVAKQPPVASTIRLANYNLGRWYLERDESIFRVEPAPFAHSGTKVGVADVTLHD